MSQITIRSPGREAWDMFRSNIPAMAGLIILLTILGVTLYGSFIYTGDAYDIVWAPHEPPGVTPEFPLGTDYLGRDLVAGLLTGGGPTLAVGAAAAAITMVIGLLVGALAGYFGGWIDNLLMRVTEFFQVLPALLFAMVLVTLFTPSLFVIALAIGVVSWPQTARLTRAEFLKIRELEYVTASRAIGTRNWRIMWRVILPNAAPPLIVSATLTVGVAILFEAGLSFLGLGDPNVMSWGLMIGANREYILDAWWPVTLPGLAIFFTVLSVSLIGDGLNDAFNPKLRKR
ncbi:ABC transporter permease [Aliishimia ponticola]|uniref:ABC transporter permease n=2 Tax=Aliishimia ponticola TaxID=2499833 RepID=A0A4V3XKM0_9RHOB|nr:ABC transporter permease [Aliishimia ponticola]THH37473.1 ABC transporter permease [Aliishimia ponticola]